MNGLQTQTAMYKVTISENRQISMSESRKVGFQRRKKQKKSNQSNFNKWKLFCGWIHQVLFYFPPLVCVRARLSIFGTFELPIASDISTQREKEGGRKQTCSFYTHFPTNSCKKWSELKTFVFVVVWLSPNWLSVRHSESMKTEGQCLLCNKSVKKETQDSRKKVSKLKTFP